MKKQIVAATILAAMVSSGIANAADANNADREKCYGVAKAGKNDCAAKDKSNSCAGQASRDGSPNNWVYVPVGLCDKLAGGTKG